MPRVKNNGNCDLDGVGPGEVGDVSDVVYSVFHKYLEVQDVSDKKPTGGGQKRSKAAPRSEPTD